MNEPSLQTEKSQTLTVVAKDNHKFDLMVFDPPAADPSGHLIICLPAMGVPAKHYSLVATHLSALGHTVFAADLRGLGTSSLRASRKVNFGYLDLVAYDIAAMVEQIRLTYPDRKCFLLGHSLGGQLATLYSGMCPDSIDGLILVACGSVHFRNWEFPRSLQILLGTRLAKLLVSILGYFPGKKIGFAGTEAKNVMLDWAHLAATGLFQPIGSRYDFEASFALPTLPILAISLEGDWFAPRRALKALCNKLVNAHPTFFHLTQPETPGETLHHFNWIKHSRPVVDKLSDWLTRERIQ